MHARDIMTTSVHVIWQNAPVESAVVDADGGLVGMVSGGDLLWHRVSADTTAHLWRHLKGAQEDAQHRLDEYGDGPRRWTADVVRGSPPSPASTPMARNAPLSLCSPGTPLNPAASYEAAGGRSAS
jgi:hypothetical protein